MDSERKKMKQIKNLIIGGGISGLTAAYYLKKDFLIVEKEQELGGYCRTIHNPNYVWDYAGHFYHFKTEQMKQLFLSLVEEDEIITQTKVTKIYYKGKLIDYPFQSNIHQLEKNELLECVYDLFFKEEKETYDSFLDMLYGKFGGAITEKFLKPYNEKLYATNLTTLDRDAMGRFFPYANLSDIIKNFKNNQTVTYNDHFLYLKQGTQYFIDKLRAQIDQDSIISGVKVEKIDLGQKVAQLSDGTTITYQNLINTSPLNQFFEVLGDDYSQILSEMSFNKVLVFNLGFNKKSSKYNQEHWVYFPDKTLNFYRVGFYDNILNQDKLSLYVEIGFSKDASIDVDKELAKTLDGLRAVEILDDEIELVDKSVIIMDPAYVHINGDTDKKITSIKEQLEQQNVYTTGRYGKWTYSSMEDCMTWAYDIAQQLNN
jgi:Protoporphyrinogen oxidase